MKRFLWTIVPLLAASLFVRASELPNPSVGNELKRVCSETGDDFDHGLCMGYILAFEHALNGLQETCPPLGVTYGQEKLVVLKFLENHPERLHEDSGDLIFDALHAAWPCGTKK